MSVFKSLQLYIFTLILTLSYTLPAQNIIEWDQTYGGEGWEEFTTLIPTQDGNFVLGGNSSSSVGENVSQASYGAYDIWIAKIDITGNFLWDRRFGGDKEDKLWTIIELQDGGLLIGGSSMSGISGIKSAQNRGERDYWILRLDPDGNLLWERTYGGTGEDLLSGGIMEAPDGSFYIAGSSKSDASFEKSDNSKGEFDFWIIKTDASGNILWDRTIGATGIDRTFTASLAQDGSCLVAGFSTSDVEMDKSEPFMGVNDYWLVKIDEFGNKVWDKTYGGDGEDVARAILPVSTGGYLLAGSSTSNANSIKRQSTFGSHDFWVLRIDEQGTIQWEATYGGSEADWAYALAERMNGEFLIGGPTRSDATGNKLSNLKGNSDFWVIRIDEQGNSIFDYTYGGDGPDVLTDMVAISDGSFMLAGPSSSNASLDKSDNTIGTINANDVWVVKTTCELESMIRPTQSIVCTGEEVGLIVETDCTTCTATWEDGSVGMTRKEYPNENTEYRLQLLDVTGCQTLDTVQIQVESRPTYVDLTVNQPGCSDTNSGSIYINSVEGGIFPILFSLNGQTVTTNTIFENLPSGNYQLRVGVGSCSLDTMINLNAVAPLETAIIAEADQINIGDSILVEVLANKPNITAYWSNPNTLSCDTCLSTMVFPSNTTNYLIIIQDENGCMVEEQLTINVERPTGLYAPTAFSPNGDNINDYYLVSPSNNIQQIDNFYIANDWGEIVYQTGNINFETSMIGWDGTFNGEPAAIGTYIYVATATLKNGTSDVFRGTFQLLR